MTCLSEVFTSGYHMPNHTNKSRRAVLRGLATVGVAGIGLSTVGSAGADKIARGDFGRVWANGTLYRTNVVHVLDERAEPDDKIFFLHDGTSPIVATDAGMAQGSPFVSESAPGDRDWNGGQWTHISAEVTDLEAFAADAPLQSEDAVRSAGYIETERGRPGFGPPNYFICPLNGRA